MTAYGRGEYELGDSIFVAEIRSFNHRYRDIVLRVPKNFQVLEKDLKSIISSRINRGRIEVSIQAENNGEESQYELELNEPLVGSYVKIFNELSEQFGIEQKIQPESFCQMRDVILVKPQVFDVEKVKPGFQEVVKQALDDLDVMRIKEGEAIEVDFLKRLDMVENLVDEVDKRRPYLVEEYRGKLRRKINSILEDMTVDEGRLAQEVALFADRSAITEEIVRIRSHLKQIREYLCENDSIGRRLDFLIQEINREVNTIGSKASDALISKAVVEMKSELEKIREQVQNIE